MYNIEEVESIIRINNLKSELNCNIKNNKYIISPTYNPENCFASFDIVPSHKQTIKYYKDLEESSRIDMFFDYQTGEITPKLVSEHEYNQVMHFINDLKTMEANGLRDGNINYDATKRAIDSYQKRLKRY